jgi:hypothetical protein
LISKNKMLKMFLDLYGPFFGIAREIFNTNHICINKNSGSDQCLICWLTRRGTCYPWDPYQALKKWDPGWKNKNLKGHLNNCYQDPK